jgi:hypothetical protein
MSREDKVNVLITFKHAHEKQTTEQAPHSRILPPPPANSADFFPMLPPPQSEGQRRRPGRNGEQMASLQEAQELQRC